MILFGDTRIDLIVLLTLLMICSGVAYMLMLFVLSRKEPNTVLYRKILAHKRSTGKYLPEVVFLVPCLNEARVIRDSVQKLLELPYDRTHIVVIDDGSDDGTSEIVRGIADPRVHLLTRTLPNARRGKGEALNHAIEFIRAGNVIHHVDPNHVIVCVVDADGMLEPQVLDEVLPLFGEPSLGAVQIGVRINNRISNLLARMQDIEFYLYTEVFQRGRRFLGSVGLGGNGQFVRLSALNSLGEKPWTRSLAEDLDLGVRILLRGWHIEFCSSTSVHQQGLIDLKRWLRQRTRWFQGHLQTWGLIPSILTELRGIRRLDLYYHVTSPFLFLLGSLLSGTFWLWIIGVLTTTTMQGSVDVSWWWLSAYLIAFGPSLLVGVLYWKTERSEGLNIVEVIGLMHLYVAYSSLWYFAGWRAVGRTVIRRTGWAKTERLPLTQTA